MPSVIDWFKRAKEARGKKDNERKEKDNYGFLGSKYKAYHEAEEALEDEDKRQKGTDVASAE